MTLLGGLYLRGMAVQHQLTSSEAVPLAHALVEHCAGVLHVRALAIKGRVASHYGLRREHASADADVLVDPEYVEVLVATLGQCGWVERPHSAAAADIVTHSITLVHPRWPCDLDIHRSWPGALGSAGAVFDELWRRRSSLEIGGIGVTIPDRASSILLAALHALRTPAQTPRHSAEYRQLLSAVVQQMTEEEKCDVRNLAVVIGAADTARPFLQRLGVTLPSEVPPGADPALDQWRERAGASGVVAAQLSMRARELPLAQRLPFLARSLWPPEREFRLDHPETAPGATPLLKARILRLGRGVRSIRPALRGRRMARLGKADDSVLGVDQ